MKTNTAAIAELESAISSALTEIETVRTSPPAAPLFPGAVAASGIDYDTIQTLCRYVGDKINTLRAAREGRAVRVEPGLGWVIA